MKLIESVYKHPEDWELQGYHFVHKPSTQAIWIANGVSFCNTKPAGVFSWYEKWKMWKAFKWWLRNKDF